MNSPVNRSLPQRQPISVLSDDLASQIAAGEVVERPASVVKELIENALDAGASRVDIVIEAGGVGLIEVIDDGKGIHPDDAELSLMRHATSKLRAFADLDELGSYGFRGEALPSIASVSRLRIETRHESQDAGLLLVSEGTTKPKLSPCGRPVGTTISVRDLFYNVPARRKFLRSSNTESGHISEIVQDAALSRPDVSFRLVRDGRPVRDIPRVSSSQKRVEQVLDESGMLIVSGQRGPVVVEAFLAPAERARRGALGLKLVINGRPIRDRALAATVAHAFGPRLDKGRYPRGVIYIELPRRLVDVNVHPQKTEVRFVDGRAMCDALYGIVARGLSQQADGPAPRSASQDFRAARPSVPSDRPTSTASDRVRVAVDTKRPPVSGNRYIAQGLSVTAPAGRRDPSLGADRQREREDDLQRASTQVDRVMRTAERATRGLRLLGQAQDSFLVCAQADGVAILDQHAADEVSIFLRLNQAYRSGGLTSQALLFPTTLSLNKRDTELLDKKSALLLRVGLDVRVRGEGSVSLHGIMGAVKRASPEATVRGFIEAARAAKDEASLVAHFFSTLACQEAVPPGTPLGLGDAGAILKGLAGIDLEQGLPACHHGRPLLSTTLYSELARKAER